MLGVFLALCSAATFALNNTFARRGVLTGSAVQALSISVPIGVPMFFLGALVTSSLGWLFEFSLRSCIFLALAGIVHFVVTDDKTTTVHPVHARATASDVLGSMDSNRHSITARYRIVSSLN